MNTGKNKGPLTMAMFDAVRAGGNDVSVLKGSLGTPTNVFATKLQSKYHNLVRQLRNLS